VHIVSDSLVEIDFDGIDFSQNEGAKLLNDVIISDRTYHISFGLETMTLGGPIPFDPVDGINNLNNKYDWRYHHGKNPGKKWNQLPPEGVDAIIGINPGTWIDEMGRNLPIEVMVFHELAEAFATVDGMMQYQYQDGRPGAHDEAIRREHILRTQRPYLQHLGPPGVIKSYTPFFNSSGRKR
jgi:hypothetical protein